MCLAVSYATCHSLMPPYRHCALASQMTLEVHGNATVIKVKVKSTMKIFFSNKNNGFVFYPSCT
jgi:hypothetical protein